MKIFIIITSIVSIFILSFISILAIKKQLSKPVTPWKIRSIDTMKYSRDLAREKLIDPEFDKVIHQQMANIAETGANYVAIGTPYDQEFIPILKRWVSAARENQLHVWFRGNWAGWEQWFEYPAISRSEHLAKTQEFILQNPDLFQDGDIFEACPECENGGPGDPRFNQDLDGHRKFLIQLYQLTSQSFHMINKQVTTSFFSMNYDVASLVMDQDTTSQLGGTVVVDHYLQNPLQYTQDIEKLVRKSGGKVVISEIGIPIPDIHNNYTEQQQVDWLKLALEQLQIPDVVGINYWVSVGGSTALWQDNNRPKPTAKILAEFYNTISTGKSN